MRVSAVCGMLSLGAAGVLGMRQGSQGPVQARATLHDAQGREVGTATLTQAAAGTLARLELHGLAPGWHGVHVHAAGKCEPPFQTAGSHWDMGGHPHGVLGSQGGHSGDLPNVLVGADSSATVEFQAPRLAISGAESALDADGAAIVVHAGPDDYKTDPSGNSGARIACGVLGRM